MAKKKAAKKQPTTRRTRKATKKKAATKKKRAARKKAAATRPVSTPANDRQRAQYAAHTNRAAKRGREITRAGRDLCDKDAEGNWLALPEPEDFARREACRFDFQLFCETYLPDFFDLDWSPAHLRVFEKAEQAVLKGGLFALAMPRGSGKTTIAIAAVLWAIVYGHRQSVVLFGATKEAAVELMTIIKAILEGEDFPIFAADFPEICIPCAELEDKAIKVKGQLYQGKSTRMKWDADKVQLPRIPGSVSAGACIRTRGLGGHMRGMIHRIGGRIIRPDLVILDDPQTDESAMSPEETKKRYKTIDKGVRGLAGPGKRIAGIMPCTVIEQNDLADRILTGAPGWKSERIPALTDFAGIPEETIELWEQYREIFVQEMNGDEYPQSNEFYQKHQKKLDAGIDHYWPERIEEGYVSAIQHAISWYLTRPESFWSEFMQKPEGEADPDADLLSVDEIKEKQHDQKMHIVPNDADVITAFVDVQHSVFYWVVIAFNRKNFSAYVLDYGAWPDQKGRNFKFSQLRWSLQKQYKGRRGAKLGLHNVIRRGMNDCLQFLHDMEFRSVDGRRMKIQRMAVDCRDGELSNELRDIIAAYDSPLVFAAMGVDSEFTGKPKPGDRMGDCWRARTLKTFGIRQLSYLPNHWKSFTHRLWATDCREPGSLSLFQLSPHLHQTYAEHQRAEQRTPIEIRTPDGLKRYDAWKCPPGLDNHWFDCTVGCVVLAAHEGCQLWNRPSNQEKPKRKSLQERQRERLEQAA